MLMQAGHQLVVLEVESSETCDSGMGRRGGAALARGPCGRAGTLRRRQAYFPAHRARLPGRHLSDAGGAVACRMQSSSCCGRPSFKLSEAWCRAHTGLLLLLHRSSRSQTEHRKYRLELSNTLHVLHNIYMSFSCRVPSVVADNCRQMRTRAGRCCHCSSSQWHGSLALMHACDRWPA